MTKRDANQILDETFLEMRAKLLEVAADFDRIDRSADQAGGLTDENNLQRQKLNQAIELLLTEGPDRAERLQKLFSREYSEQCRSDMQL